MADATDTSANAKAVKKVKSKHRILAMGKKVVKEVLGGGGNNDSVAQPPKGQTVRTYGRGGVARPKVKAGPVMDSKNSLHPHGGNHYAHSCCGSTRSENGRGNYGPYLTADSSSVGSSSYGSAISLPPPTPTSASSQTSAPYLSPDSHSTGLSSRRPSSPRPTTPTNVSVVSAPSATANRRRSVSLTHSPRRAPKSGPPTVITNCSTDAFFEQLLSEIPRSPKRAPIPSPSKRHAPKVSPRKYQEDKTPQPPRKTRNHLAPLQRPGTAEVEKMEALLEKTTTVVGFPTTPSWNSFEFDASVGLSSQGTDSGDEESQAPAESHKERMEKVTHGVGGTTSRTGKRRTRPLPALPELCAPVTSDVRNDRQNTNTNRPPAGDVRTSAAQGTPESHLPQQSAPQGFTPVPPPYDATTQTFQLNPFLASQAASLGFGTSAGQVPQANYPLHLGQAAPAGWNALSQHLLPQAQIPAPPLVGAADHAQVMSSIQAQQQQVRNLELYLALANLSLRIANEGRLPQDL